MTDTEQTEPVQEPLKLRIDGRTYMFPTFDTLSYEEADLIQEQTRFSMGKFFKRLEDGDTNCLVAIALVAKRREIPDFQAEELRALNLGAIEIITPQEDGPGPLVEPSGTKDPGDAESSTNAGGEPSPS